MAHKYTLERAAEATSHSRRQGCKVYAMRDWIPEEAREMGLLRI